MINKMPLPGKDETRVSYDIDLDGVVYTVRINWNERVGGWFIDLSDDNGTVVSGRRLSTNWPVLYKDTGRSGPPGEMMLVSMTESTDEPGIDELANYSLMYLDADELGRSV